MNTIQITQHEIASYSPSGEMKMRINADGIWCDKATFHHTVSKTMFADQFDTNILGCEQMNAINAKAKTIRSKSAEIGKISVFEKLEMPEVKYSTAAVAAGPYEKPVPIRVEVVVFNGNNICNLFIPEFKGYGTIETEITVHNIQGEEFVLPECYRPAYLCQQPIIVISDGSEGFGIISITTDGKIKISNGCLSGFDKEDPDYLSKIKNQEEEGGTGSKSIMVFYNLR